MSTRRTATQVERVAELLRRAGRRGITQIDADALHKPIRRLASRVRDLRNAGYVIETRGRRHKLAVYVLVAERERQPTAPVLLESPEALFEAPAPAPRSALDPWEGA